MGAQLSAVMGNLAMGIAGAFASALAIMMYELVMEGVMGLMGRRCEQQHDRSNSQIDFRILQFGSAAWSRRGLFRVTG